MNLTTIAEGLGWFLAVFGIVALGSLLGVSIHKAGLVDDVYEEQATFQGTTALGMPDPATSTDADVRQDWQDVGTIEGWEASLRSLGLGSLLSGIGLVLALVVYRGVAVMSAAPPDAVRGCRRAEPGRRGPPPSEPSTEGPAGGADR